MNGVTDLKMAIDTTFSSILNEIQLSNLNFTLQITPFAAYITLKKSVITDQNGAKALPAPPILFLLQQAQHTIQELRELNDRHEIQRNATEKTIKNLMNENASLVKAIDASDCALAASKATNDTLHIKLQAAEENILKLNSSKDRCEENLKESKKINLQEMNHAKSNIKALEKSGKVLEKEIHNLKRDLEISRENLKKLRSDNSSLKISKAKLEKEKRKLEKVVDQKDSKVTKLNMKEASDINENYLKLEYPTQICSFSDESKQELNYSPSSSTSGPSYSSMITHWNPLPLKTSTIVTMVSHTVQPPPSICSLWNAQEYQEMINKLCERVFAKLGWEKFK